MSPSISSSIAFSSGRSMCSSCSNWFGLTSCQNTTANQNSSLIIPTKMWAMVPTTLLFGPEWIFIFYSLFYSQKKKIVLRTPLKSLTDWCRIKLTAYLYCQISSPIQYGIIKWLQYLLFHGSTHVYFLMSVDRELLSVLEFQRLLMAYFHCRTRIQIRTRIPNPMAT